MKQILFVFAVTILCSSLSCNNEKRSNEKMTGEVTGTGDQKNSEIAQKNLEATHVVTNAFQTGDVSGIDNAVASDFVDHTERGDMGRDSLKAMITRTHATHKDMKMEIVKELADDDYVMSWMRYTGTSDGSMGMPKGPFDMHGIEVVKFKDGKAIEHWGFMESREMMKMMSQAGNKK